MSGDIHLENHLIRESQGCRGKEEFSALKEDKPG